MQFVSSDTTLLFVWKKTSRRISFILQGLNNTTILFKLEQIQFSFHFNNNSDTMTQVQVCNLNLQVHKNAKLTENPFSHGLCWCRRWGDLDRLWREQGGRVKSTATPSCKLFQHIFSSLTLHYYIILHYLQNELERPCEKLYVWDG